MQQPTRLLVGAALLTGLAAQAGDYPDPVQAMVLQGARIEAEFKAPGGLQGFAARFRGQPLTLYVTPDGEHLIVGSMLDGEGRNLSQQHLEQYLPEPSFDDHWAVLEKTHWVADGPDDARRVVYVFTDPNCPYCNAFWQAARPHIGPELQVRHLLVGLLSPTSMGKAAAILDADDPAAALEHHERHHREGGIEPLAEIPRELQRQLSEHTSLMAELDAHGTPAIFYRDAEGRVRRVIGMPPEDRLQEILHPGSGAEN